MSLIRRIHRLGLVSAIALLAPGFAAPALAADAAKTPAAPAFVRKAGGIPLPDKPVLDTYDKAVVTEKLAIAPVAAGFGPMAEPLTDEKQRPQIDPLAYAGTIYRLQGIVNAIAKAGPRPDIVPRIRLEFSARTDAYTPSNSEIVLTTGVLAMVSQNTTDVDAQLQRLVFLLGHEYAHVLYDHPNRFAQKSKPVPVGDLISTGLVLFAAVNQLAGPQQDGGSLISQDIIGGLQGALALSPLIELELHRIGYAPYRKEQESLADFASVDFFGKRRLAYGDPRSASKVLDAYEKYDDNLIAQLQKATKTLESRLKTNLSAFAEAAPDSLMNGGLQSTLDMAKGRILAAIVEAAMDIIKRHFDKDKIHLYYSSDRRIEAISAYAGNFQEQAAQQVSTEDAAAFDESAKPAETGDAFAKRVNIATPSELFNGFNREYGPDQAATTASQLNVEGKYAEARKLLDAARAQFIALTRNATADKPAPPKKPDKKPAAKGKARTPASAPAAAAPPPRIRSAFFHMVDGQTYSFEGRLAEAELAYARAIDSVGAPVSAYITLASIRDALRKPAAALSALDLAGKRFGDREVIVARIKHYVGTGELEAAKALVTRCESYGDLAKECAAAVPKPKSDDDADDDDGKDKKKDSKKDSKKDTGKATPDATADKRK
ncbi:MAG: hypothetical protein CFE37_10075 [Alphaproteobacteria bacterium PA4]|nr:MAG: hypothetical protein CFE37_10075 [Alphaproteobacteria bacterium PA4]